MRTEDGTGGSRDDLYPLTMSERRWSQASLDASIDDGDFGPSQLKPVGLKGRYYWGSLWLEAAFDSKCIECGLSISKGENCWYRPKAKLQDSTRRGFLRCNREGCRPDPEKMRLDELVDWYVAFGQHEEDEHEDDSVSEQEREGLDGDLRRLELGLVPFGVRWLEGSDEENWEILSREDEDEDFLLFSSVVTDARNTRDLTDPAVIRSIPFEKILADLDSSIGFHVSQACRKSNHTLEGDDLRSEAQVALYKSLGKFEGIGSFGAYANQVVPHALVDYFRRQRRFEHGLLTEQVMDKKLIEDPTDGWILKLDLQRLLPMIPNGHLILLKGAGYASADLGDPDVIDMRVSRARARLRGAIFN